MKKIFSFLIMGLFLSALSLNAKVLNVGTNANFPPFEYMDDNAAIVGFDIDLIKELSKRSGFEAKIINMSFDSLIPALKTSKIDIAIAGMSATPDRIKAIDFTDPYYVTENLYLKKLDNSALTSKNELKGKKIGVQIGTVQEITAKTIKDAKVLPVEDPIAAIMMLKNNKVDAVIIDSSVGYGYLKNNTELVEFLKEPDGSNGFAIAFDKNKNTDLINKFNGLLKEIKSDGTYDKLLEKYNLK